MSIGIPKLNANTDTFETLFTKVNQTIDLAATSNSVVALTNDYMQVANTNTLISGVQTTVADRMQVANVNTLVNDRMQVANVNSLISGVQTTVADRMQVANVNSLISGVQTTISDRMQVANVNTLVNDRMQVANVNSLISGVQTTVSDRMQVANVNSLISGVQTTVNDRLQVANATSLLATKASVNNPTFTGNAIFNDATASRLNLKDYGEMSTTISSFAGSVTFDVTNGNAFQLTLSENITTVDINNPTASGNVCAITVKITQGTGGYSITWPASFKWPGGTAGTISASNNAVDILTAVTWDAGTIWNAVINSNFS